jgi:uncharacterized protein (DUF3084 family)
MAFLAPVAAELGGRTMGKVLPWALLGMAIFGLGAAIWVQSARLEAAQAQARSLEQRLQAATVDAARWQAASGARDDVIRDQATQLERLKADAALAQRVADETEAARQQQMADLNQQIVQWKARAHAHPDQVRPLGPIVVDVLGSLHDQATRPATDSAGH